MTEADDVVMDVPELVAALAGGDPPTVLDVRWRLAAPGAGQAEYAAGHLPGAVFLDLDSQVCGPPGAGGRHPLPDADRLGAVLRAAGVRAGHPVVVYDGGDGAAAARTWWTLRWAGHPRVRVLDGGYAAWRAAGAPVDTAPVRPAAGDFLVRPGGLPVLDAAATALLAGGSGSLLDARAPARYRGETEPVDPVAGHIPGAVNLPTTDLTSTGRLRPAADLRAMFHTAGVRDGAPVGAYCGSGVTAAQTVLALHRAGRPDAGLYVGSWSHWITDRARPVAGQGSGGHRG